jgi:Ca2+/H+ antiporter, TMEM165/GDT1 family
LEAFLTSAALVAVAEIGDKTQLAAVALGARYHNLSAVVLGTTLGMMVANIPAVIVGEKWAHRLPMTTIRWVAAALFVALGLATLFGARGADLR